MFKKVEFEDLKNLRKFLEKRDTLSCENTLANLSIWSGLYNAEYFCDQTTVIIKLTETNGDVFSIPYYTDFNRSIDIVIEYCQKNGIPPVFWFEEGKSLNLFNKNYGNLYNQYLVRDNCEYIYLSENLANLSGKRYHSKRNHISSFNKKYNYVFEELNSQNKSDILFIENVWYASRGNEDSETVIAEKKGLSFLLDNIDFFSLKGGLLRVDGQAVAFTIANQINDKVTDILFEKALPDFQSAYSVINNEFAKRVTTKYINREDDLGIEGLRKSKLSYNPEIILKKYLCLPKILYESSKNLHIKTFGDNKKFADLLFSAFFPNNFLYKYSDGKVVSQLFLIDGQINKEKCGYIYAAATDKEYRRRGYMGELVEKSKSLYPKIALKPATESLYNFYEKFGFKTVFYAKTRMSLKDEYEKVKLKKVIEVEDYKAIRQTLLPENTINFCSDAIKIILSEYQIVTNKDEPSLFLATFLVEGKNLLIKELISKIDPEPIVYTLMKQNGCNNFNIDYFSVDADTPSGMIYPQMDIKLYLGNAID